MNEGEQRSKQGPKQVIIALLALVLLVGMMVGIYNMIMAGKNTSAVIQQCNAHWIKEIKSKGSMNWLVSGDERFIVTNFTEQMMSTNLTGFEGG